jgi:hypothetical protein
LKSPRLICVSAAYVIIEAHHYATALEASSHWTLIIMSARSILNFTVALKRPNSIGIRHLIVLVWYQHQEHLLKLHQQLEKPWCVTRVEEKLNFFVHGPKVSDTDLGWDIDNFMALDFDMINWSA